MAYTVGDINKGVNNKVFDAVGQSDQDMDIYGNEAQDEINVLVSAIIGTGYSSLTNETGGTGAQGKSSSHLAYMEKKNKISKTGTPGGQDTFAAELLKYDWGNKLADTYRSIRDRVEEDPNYSLGDARKDEAMALLKILKEKVEATGGTLDGTTFNVVLPRHYGGYSMEHKLADVEYIGKGEATAMSINDIVSLVTGGIAEINQGYARGMSDADRASKRGENLLQLKEFFKEYGFNEFLGDDFIDKIVREGEMSIDPSYYGRIVADPGKSNYSSPRTEFRRGY
mgnify:CR=1 FL=1